MDEIIIQNIYPDRKNLRLPDYNYSSPCAYFVTICTYKKQCLFGEIENGIMYLNPSGYIVKKCWDDLQTHYIGINNDVFAVMPNHVHGIIIIRNENGRSGSKPDPTKQHHLSEIVRAFKTYSSKGINKLHQTPGITLWQRSFYEHVIRDEKDYKEIGEYILYNSAKWESDKENTSRI
jgi:putative transposase